MMDKAPIVRVEFEYADGSIQRLTGPPAEAWLEDVNNVIALTHIRYSRSPIEEYPWEWSKRATEKKKKGDLRSSFDEYDGTD